MEYIGVIPTVDSLEIKRSAKGGLYTAEWIQGAKKLSVLTQLLG